MYFYYSIKLSRTSTYTDDPSVQGPASCTHKLHVVDKVKKKKTPSLVQFVLFLFHHLIYTRLRACNLPRKTDTTESLIDYLCVEIKRIFNKVLRTDFKRIPVNFLEISRIGGYSSKFHESVNRLNRIESLANSVHV